MHENGNCIPSMKKFLMILGGLFLVLLVVVGVVIGFAAYNGSGLDEASKAYVDESVPAIVSTWSKEELLKRCSPQLLEVLNQKPEQIQGLFDKLSKLGAMKHYDGSKGQASMFYDAKHGKTITAEYVAHATFEQSPASISIRLVQLNGRWEFLLFNVNSPFFLQ